MLIDNLANLNRATRNTILTTLAIIATIAMYNWIVSPHITYLFAAQGYESAVGKAVEKNKVITRKIEAKTKQLEELYEQLARTQSTMFTPDEAKEFFRDLQAVLEETGCTIRSLNVVASKPSFGDKRSKNTSNLAIVANSATLSIIGQYDSINRLVEKLQNHAKKIWIDSFRMESIELGSAQLKCDMTITIYTIKDKEATL